MKYTMKYLYACVCMCLLVHVSGADKFTVLLQENADEHLHIYYTGDLETCTQYNDVFMYVTCDTNSASDLEVKAYPHSSKSDCESKKTTGVDSANVTTFSVGRNSIDSLGDEDDLYTVTDMYCGHEDIDFDRAVNPFTTLPVVLILSTSVLALGYVVWFVMWLCRGTSSAAVSGGFGSGTQMTTDINF